MTGKPLFPSRIVCRDYFRHLTTEKLVRKVTGGEIALPLLRLEKSQKCAKGIHLQDLANYLDQQRALAVKEMQQLQGR